MALLSKTSKMPGPSFSLPAGTACPTGRKMVEKYASASVCANCYARRGRYLFESVKNSRIENYKLMLDSIRRNDDSIIKMMNKAIKEYKGWRGPHKYFRVHDSGDLFNVEYVRLWIEIVKANPDVKFWFPTREHKTDDDELLEKLKELNALPNVTVRPSAIRINEAEPYVEGLSAPTYVMDAETADINVKADKTHRIHKCPATFGDDHTCYGNNCYACWESEPIVIYRLH